MGASLEMFQYKTTKYSTPRKCSNICLTTKKTFNLELVTLAKANKNRVCMRLMPKR